VSLVAVACRSPSTEATILHSDHGAQYTSWAFGRRLREAGLRGSTGTVGDCFDNAMMESFWGTIQVKLLDVKEWQSRTEPAAAMFEWIECLYNPFRRHSGIGMLSPVTFEEQHGASQTGR
jgi:putative transposase